MLASNPKGDKHLAGARLSYVDLSLFQLVEGLLYAFPKATTHALKKTLRVLALRDRGAQQRRVAAYLRSERRITFNENGIFRCYPGLDGCGVLQATKDHFDARSPKAIGLLPLTGLRRKRPFRCVVDWTIVSVSTKGREYQLEIDQISPEYAKGFKGMDMISFFWEIGYEPPRHAPCSFIGHRYPKMEFGDIRGSILRSVRQ